MAEKRVSDEELEKLLQHFGRDLGIVQVRYGTGTTKTKQFMGIYFALTELQHYRTVMKGVEAMLQNMKESYEMCCGVTSIGNFYAAIQSEENDAVQECIHAPSLIDALASLVKSQRGAG